MITIGSQIHMVTPMDTNQHGTIFGGKIMELADQAGSILARKISRKQVLTAALDKIDFLHPIHIGEEAHVTPRLVCTYRSSMQIAVEVKALNPLTQEERKTAKTLITFVAIDEKTLRPAPIPPIDIEESDELEFCRLRYKERKSSKIKKFPEFPKKILELGKKPGKTVAQSIVENHHLVMPGDHDSVGFLFAGRYLAWVDIVGALCARRHCQEQVVTAAIEEVEFKVKIPKGSTIRLVAKPIFVSNFSVQVQVTGWLWDEDFGGADVKIADAFLTFVSLDLKTDKVIKVPQLKISNEEEKKAYLLGQWRYLKRKK